MNRREIGTCAMIVWQLLIDNARWSYEELKKKSGLMDKDLGAALGWLAHENRVEFEENDDDLYVYLAVNVYIG